MYMSRLSYRTTALILKNQCRRFSGIVPVVEKTEAQLAVDAAATEAKAAAPKPVPKLKQHTSLWRSRISAFAVGAASVAVFGLLRIQEDVNQANVELKTRLVDAHADVTLLNKKIKELEQRMANYEQHGKTLVTPFEQQKQQQQNH